MELIQNNPYRIAGILANVTAKELEKQKGKIRAFARIGREIESDYDFQILDNITRTEDSIDKAFSTIEQNQDKVNFSLFWFLNANPFDNTAIEYLKIGDAEKAVEIWEKVTHNKEVNSKNFSAFNNLGTHKLLSQTQDDIKEGIEAKIKLIESDYFKNFVHSVADDNYTIDNEKQIRILIDELISEFKNKYSSSEILELFSNCNGSVQKYLSEKITEEPIHKIESQIENSKNKRKINKIGAYNLGLKLFTNSKNDLLLLKSLLGENDLNYKSLADQLANEIMQCGIDYFKARKDTLDPSSEGLRLLKHAESIAVRSRTRNRISENIEGIEEWVETAPIKEVIDVFSKEIKNIENELFTKKDSDENNDFKKSIQKRRVNSSEKLIKSILKLYKEKAINTNAANIIEKVSFAIHAIQNQLALAINNAQETKSKRIRPVMNNNGSFSLQSEDAIDMKNLKEIASSSLDISFLTFKFKTSENISKYRNKNQSMLIRIAEELNLSIKSPEEKIRFKINNLKSKLSETKDKVFNVQKLTETENQLKEIEKWKLFRSKEKRESEINQQLKSTEKIKQNGESEKQSKLRDIENQITEQKSKLQTLKYKS